MLRSAFPLLLAAVLLASCSERPPAFRATALPGVEWGGDFTLTSHRGTPLDTASLRGKLQVLFFGFTHCPDICAPTLVKLAQATRALGADGQRVQVLFVTVDPDHDTPPQLAAFLAKIDPAFIGLTGKADALKAVANDHKIYAQGSQGGITHSGSLLVKDASGRMRLVIPEAATVEDIVHDLRLLLRQ